MADDAFTEANKLRRQVVAIDRARAIITTREDVERESLEREAKTKIQEQQFEIREAQEERAASTFEIQQQILMEELRAARGQLDKQETFDAFDKYNADGNPRHLNNLFKNKRIQQAEAAGGSPIVSFDKIDVANDQTLIQRSDLDPDIFAEEEAIKQFVKVTHADGTKDILDLHKIYASTGYLEQLEDEKLTKLERTVKIKKAEADIVEALRGGGVKLNLTQEANVARFISRLTPEQLEKFKSGAKIAEEIFPEKEKPLGTRERGITRTQEIKDELDERLEKGTITPEDPEFQDLVGEMVANNPGNPLFKLTGKEGETLTDLAVLVDVGRSAGQELKVESTGIIDNLFREVQVLIFEDPKFVKGRAAWTSYRNVVRHLMYGSQLTGPEITSFGQQFGKLTDKLVPLLEKFKVNLSELKTRIKSVRRLKDRHFIAARTGITTEQVDEIMQGIDKRLAAMQGYLLSADAQDIPSGAREGETTEKGLSFSDTGKIRAVTRSLKERDLGTPR